VYLLGGSAMTVHGLKDQTEDIDLALGVASEFEHVYETLLSQGFAVVDEPTESFEGAGKTVELYHEERGFRFEDSDSYSQRCRLLRDLLIVERYHVLCFKTTQCFLEFCSREIERRC